MTDASLRLRKYYASAPAGEIARETISLTHSAFSQDWHLTNFQEAFSANVDSVEVDFIIHPFTFREPEDSTTGRVEVQVDIFNTGPTFVAELQAAASDATETIQLVYGVYLEAESDPERTFTLEVQSVALGTNSITARAVGPNVLDGRYPNKFYRTSKFPGLRR